MRCHRMADARLRTCWRDHDRLADRACRAQQCLQAGSVDAVVIAKEELHGTQLDGHKRLSISSRHSYFSINIRTARAGSKAVNIELLPVLIVEEVRTLFDADSKLSEMLPEMERASAISAGSQGHQPTARFGAKSKQISGGNPCQV